MIFCFISN